MTQAERKPPWLKVRAPGGAEYVRVKETLRETALGTVCEHARCPNVGECWGSGTATVLLLGPTCTRHCRFCSVSAGTPQAVDATEPARVAAAVTKLGLRYVVLTMVTRDDLPDGGASHVAETIAELRRRRLPLQVEILASDFGGSDAALDVVLDAGPDVFSHNVEVTERLTPLVRDPRSSYRRSLQVLATARDHGHCRFIKSSLMVGTGETDDEVLATLRDLLSVGVDLVTIGQYLRPTPRHLPVARYVSPTRFSEYARAGQALGLGLVVSGPLVRSSYRAAEGFVQARSAMGPISRPRSG